MLATVVQDGTAHPTVSTCDILRECSVLITPCLAWYCSLPEGQQWRKKDARGFSHFGFSVWNSLPPCIRNAFRINIFKSALKTLFSLYQFD